MSKLFHMILWLWQQWTWTNKYLYSKMQTALGICLRVLQLDHVVDLFLALWVSSTSISIVTIPICIPTRSEWVFPFPYIHSSIWFHLFLCYCLFDLNHSDWGMMKSQSHFYLCFLKVKDIEYLKKNVSQAFLFHPWDFSVYFYVPLKKLGFF